MKKKKINAAGGNHQLQMVSAALGNDLTKVEGVAYSGGTFSQWWSRTPCVTDIDGLEITAQIPLMYNHINDPEFRLGEVSVEKVDGALHISGGVDAGTERGKAIIEAGKKCNWQLSHGAEIIDYVNIPKDTKATINGREFEGPLLHIRKAVLREISVVAIGADSDTSLRVAAGFNIFQTKKGEKTMPEKGKNVDAAAQAADPVAPAASAQNENKADIVAAERARVKSVRAALKDYPTLIDKAIEAGWDEDRCKETVADIKAATAGCQAGMNILTKNEKPVDGAVLEAALSFRAGIEDKSVVASFGEEIADRADGMRGMSLKEALVAACQMKGIRIGYTVGHEEIKAAFTVTDLPVILGNVANKRMLQEYKRYPIIAHKLCSIGDLPDYKESSRARLADFGNLEVVPLGGTVKEGAMGEDSATNKVERYAKIFWLDEALIVNDDLGAFLKIPKIFGAKAARLVDQVFFKRLLANPGNLFSADNKNYLSGTTSALSLDGLKALRTLFLKQVDSTGEPVAVDPSFLVVPPSLDVTARELVTATTVVTGEAATRPAANVVGKGLEVVTSPYLEAEGYAGNSATGWYLFGDPNLVDTFEVGYLKGRKEPVVERGEFDLSKFGISYRVSHHFGVREQGTVGMAFAKGVN